MIDPTFQLHRDRLSKAADYWNTQMDAYRKDRKETVINYVGSTELAKRMGVSGDKKILGNLIQQQGQAHSIALAYNDPRFYCVANMPGNENIAIRGEEWLAHYLPLIKYGATGRSIALDSYFGWGILKVGVGFVPPSVRNVTKQAAGPCAWRISQDNYGLDGSASSWDELGYQYDFSMVPLDEAKKYAPFLEYNPEETAKLEEFSQTGAHTTSRVDGNNQNSRYHTPEAMVRLVTFYFPGANVEAIWPANSFTFSELTRKPLLVRPWKGHHTGPFGVLSHLDIPDNLLPVAACESTKQIHYLFNELADITSQQALEAKYNPIFELGSQRDIERWQATPDRKPFPVASVARFGSLQIPGPDQSQTGYMAVLEQMFKEFSAINSDDVLGTSQTADTATGSELIRQSTTIRVGEARRKMNMLMELGARKLLQLALVDETMTLPMRRPIPRTNLSRDVSWLPPSQLPRTGDVDQFSITLVEGSMEPRPATARLASIREAIGEIITVAQAVAGGVPLSLERFVELQAKYRDIPELRDLCEALLPDYAEAKAGAQAPSMNTDKPNGNYTRTNVSERSDEGSAIQALTQVAMGGQQGGAAA